MGAGAHQVARPLGRSGATADHGHRGPFQDSRPEGPSSCRKQQLATPGYPVGGGTVVGNMWDAHLEDIAGRKVRNVQQPESTADHVICPTSG